MSCLSEGERDENQRPALIDSRSSMLRMGSSIACLVCDLKLINCREGDLLLDDTLVLTRGTLIYKWVFLYSKMQKCQCPRSGGVSYSQNYLALAPNANADFGLLHH